MLLLELFPDDETSLKDKLRQELDVFLAPLAATKVEFIEMKDIAKVLHKARTGLIIDRGLIMSLIDPQVCSFVKQIDGDKVYLAIPIEQMSADTEEDAERNKEKIAKTAANTAKKAVTK